MTFPPPPPDGDDSGTGFDGWLPLDDPKEQEAIAYWQHQEAQRAAFRNGLILGVLVFLPGLFTLGFFTALFPPLGGLLLLAAVGGIVYRGWHGHGEWAKGIFLGLLLLPLLFLGLCGLMVALLSR